MNKRFPKLPKKIDKNSYQNLFVLLGILFIGVIILVAFSGNRFSEPFANKPIYNIEFVHMDGCSHCERFKPIWNEVKKDSVEFSKFNFVDYERAKNLDRVNKFKIDSFPTILVISIADDKVVATYEGRRTVEDFKKFLMTYQNKG